MLDIPIVLKFLKTEEEVIEEAPQNYIVDEDEEDVSQSISI